MGASAASSGTTGDFPQLPTETGFPELEQALSVVKEHATSFARAPLADKVAWLREMSSRFRELGPRLVSAACAAKGVPLGSPLEGEEWVAAIVPIIRNLKQLANSLEQVRRSGAPLVESARVSFTTQGRAAVEMTPHEWYDGLLYAPFRAKTWLAPHVDVTELAQVQAGFYKRREPEGCVALVLGAGNVGSIPVLDVIYKSFVEGAVCVLKMSPVNAYLGPIFELAMAPLITRGFLRIVYGGPEVGAHLVAHPAIDELHITGSLETHDRIVWGPAGAERNERKRRGTPLFAKPVSSELGNISPVLLVPGKYSDAELTTMARGLCGMVVQNASFNCNAAKMLITPKGFAQREALLERLQAELQKVAPRNAYYPGAEARYASLTQGAAHVTRIGDAGPGQLPWTLITELDARASAPQFSVEPFCSILSEVSVGSADPVEFLASATEFANERLWGTLNAMLYVTPETERDPALSKALEDAIAELRYGTIALNHWPAAGYALATAPWGGHPSVSLSDVQSGLGWVHNTLLFDTGAIEKTVQRGSLRVFPAPAYFPGHRSLQLLGRALADFEADPSATGLAKVGYFAVRA
ncbi:MAG TPA: aldehyde dehydrogenase family protein [Polyangiaceae bacterium]|nr:aldehyde dehydrogenase family protein [Polyangiaceae bacterium]